MTQKDGPFTVEDRSPRRGQSLLEMALLLPILLILLAGMIEIGMYANSYMTILDAGRESARFATSPDPLLTSEDPLDTRSGYPPFPDVRTSEIISGGITLQEVEDICEYGETTNFYYIVACLAFQNVPLGQLRPENGDDIVITVLGFTGNTIHYRWPLPIHRNDDGGGPPDDDWSYHFRGADDGDTNPTCTITQTENCRCWSLFGVRGSQFANEEVRSMLRSDSPASSLVIVEIAHAHPHFIGLFNIGDFIPDPIQMRPYAIFPVPAAEPTSTPRP